jgi:glycosyltransferase involved in cell wall biosynthesis
LRIAVLARRALPCIGGIASETDDLVRGLRDLGHEVVLFAQFDGSLDARASQNGGAPTLVEGVQVVGLRSYGEERARTGGHAAFHIDIDAMVSAAVARHHDRPFDIFHAIGAFPPGLAGVRLRHQTGAPLVVTMRSAAASRVGLCCPQHALAAEAVAEHADRVFAPNTALLSELSGERGSVLPDGVDERRFAPSPGTHSGPLRLLFLGGLSREKGAADAMRSFSTLKSEGEDFRATFSGSGPDEAMLRDLGRELELEDRVRFYPASASRRREDILSHTDIVLVPSYVEGAPLRVAEAMMAGLPMILSHEAAKAANAEMATALLVPSGDVPALTRAVRRLLYDQALRTKLGQEVRAAALARHRLCVKLDVLVSAYRQAMVAEAPSRFAPMIDLAMMNGGPNCPFRLGIERL